MKRKRGKHGECTAARKRVRSSASGTTTAQAELPDAEVIRSYYPKVETLREYLRSRLSRKRSRELLEASTDSESARERSPSLHDLLATTLVGSFEKPAHLSHVDDAGYLKELRAFSQRRSVSISASTGSSGAPQAPIHDIVDYCIWLLFRRDARVSRPQHMLCRGFARSCPAGQQGLQLSASCEIAGLVLQDPNPYVEQLKSSTWSQLTKLLGGKAEQILVNLILHCGMFSLLGEAKQSWIQISGTPLTELCPLHAAPGPVQDAATEAVSSRKRPNDIRFVRHRILYGRPALNACGKVTFGLRPVHVLNRLRDAQDDQETIQVMNYVFPQQFGLHNVFTSTVSKEESSSPFLDYTVREQEIKRLRLRDKQMMLQRRPDRQMRTDQKLPKRLRGAPCDLIKAIRKRHKTCSYSKLMEHYCPAATSSSAPSDTFALATPTAQVSAFVRSVLGQLLPSRLFGSAYNLWHTNYFIDRFVRLYRYETLSLHVLMSSLQLRSMTWLCPPSQHPSAKLCQSERQIRTKLLSDVLYWVIDSLLMPLLSTNFYITESASHKNRLLFFRHDVWTRISTPTLDGLRASTFEAIPTKEASRLLRRATLGFGKVRLLPKADGARAVVNLRRRAVRKVGGREVLGPSTNVALSGAFAVLNLVRRRDKGLLGASVFSREEFGAKLLEFKERMRERGMGRARLWFVKVDVKGCFDSIPQARLMDLLWEIVAQGEYSIGRYAEGKALKSKSEVCKSKVAWRHRGEAGLMSEAGELSEVLRETGGAKNGRVYVDKVVKKYESREKIMSILGEHIERNLVQLGKQVYRQKVGIAQGGVASSLLCSLFYGDMDRRKLDFVPEQDCLLTRLIDDFLLVTPRLDVAKRFTEVMYAGLQEYGVEIRPDKSLTNFDFRMQGEHVRCLPQVTDFPYCGLSINTATLDVSADTSRRQEADVDAAMTVEHSKTAGQGLHRKSLDTAKLHMRSMLTSTRLNDVATVRQNIRDAFADMGWRCVRYMDRMGKSRRPDARLVIRTVEDLIDFAYALMMKQRRAAGVEAERSVREEDCRRIAYEALLSVFQRRQTKLSLVVEWIAMRMSRLYERRPSV